MQGVETLEKHQGAPTVNLNREGASNVRVLESVGLADNKTT